MKIYVASSWRNEARQQSMVKALRGAGHEAYDFRNPGPGEKGFGWRSVTTDPGALTDPKRFRDEVLPHPSCQKGFRLDMAALCGADCTVLVLPCGRSAHLELGLAIGAGQHTVVLFDDPMSEPELMYLACSALAVTEEEVLAIVKAF